jgi:hypothetical protein
MKIFKKEIIKMNIEEKINKYLKESVNIEDIKKLQGKNIKI